MFSRIQAERFRSLRYIDQRLDRFHALVGPNASGKTTILDVVDLLGDLMRRRGDVFETIEARSPDFRKLLWLGEGDAFRLAVEAPVPDGTRAALSDRFDDLTDVRYEIEVALDPESNELGLNYETLWMIAPSTGREIRQRDLFPGQVSPPDRMFVSSGRSRKILLRKQENGNDVYYPEGAKKAYKPVFRTGRTRAALGNVPADIESFPVSNWFQRVLAEGITNIQLDGVAIRRPSPPGLGGRFLADGSNLPWVVDRLKRDASRFEAWLEHVRTSLEDIVSIDTVIRDEDRHRYLIVEYANGARVPSWLVSDGSLRLLALTILAYLDDADDVYLIEEPENGINPSAIETVVESLSSLYDSQVLTATHSPVALNMLEPKDVLCVARDSLGATDVVAGTEHPALRDWRAGEPDLGTLFASGILS